FEAVLEVRGVLPQPFDALWLGLEDIDRRDAGGRHARWMGGAEEERPSSVDEEVPDRLRGCDVAAQHAHRLRERPDLEVDPPIEAEVVDRSASVFPQHTAGVRDRKSV